MPYMDPIGKRVFIFFRKCFLFFVSEDLLANHNGEHLRELLRGVCVCVDTVYTSCLKEKNLENHKKLTAGGQSSCHW